MRNLAKTLKCLTVVGGFVLTTGCAAIDRLGGKMDMAVNRISEENKPEFEGRLDDIKREGAMIALQISGRMFDVVEASPGLKHGDTVRIYNTEKGLVARLWKETKTTPTVSDAIQPVHRSSGT